MFVRYENQCCDCATGQFPCAGQYCKNRNVPIHICDYCKEEAPITEYEDGEYCKECLAIMQNERCNALVG